MLKVIYINTSFVGFHRWDNAPEEVSFLRDLHRHLFNVKVTIEVSHNDRDVEFFLLKKDVDFCIDRFDYASWLNGKLVWSCEMVAERLIRDLSLLEYKVVSVEVNEDWENGSIIFNTNE